jgi:saccharopine dehydrogenase-like NADP-dependent oxidoreductase
MLIDGEVTEKGIVIPERLSTQSFLERLAAKDVKIQEEIIQA